MKREIIRTADGSATIYLPDWNEHYHSRHGALQEAQHVFIQMGFHHYLDKKPSASLDVLEIGLGTGLNALISYFQAKQSGVSLNYTGVEAYPVAPEELEALEYASLFEEGSAQEIFRAIHESPWGERTQISPFFRLQKERMFFKDIRAENQFDLVFFDAFGPRVQPELWTQEIFMSMFRSLKERGVLVTYSAKGSVRRAMQEAGFLVERLPGPPGKREMLRATRKSF